MFHKVKVLVSYVLVLSAVVSLLATPAFAVTSCNQDISFMVSGEENSEDIDLSKCTLVLSDTLTVITDNEGQVVNVIEGDVPSTYGSMTTETNNRIITVNFYKSGATYYVVLTAKAKPDRWWIEKLELKYRFKGFSSWGTSTKSPIGKQNTCSVSGKYSYPDAVPSNVTVDIKWYIHTAGEYALEDFFGWSKTYTLDNP